MESLLPVNTPVLPLETLPDATVQGTDAKQREKVAQDFEAVFVSLLFSEMRKTLEADSLFSGDRGDVYGGMFDMFLGQHIAKSGQFNIAKMVNEYFESQDQSQNQR